MLLRSVLLGAASGLLLAAGLYASDPFQDAFKRAMPSPFAPQTASPEEKPGVLDFYHIILPPQTLARQMTVCSIPLVNVPIQRSKDFTIRKYEVPKTLDNMAKEPPAPACPVEK